MTRPVVPTIATALTRAFASGCAAAAKGLVWTAANIIAYVENPKEFLKASLGAKTVKNRMVFKLKSLQQRQDVVDYLEQVAKTN